MRYILLFSVLAFCYGGTDSVTFAAPLNDACQSSDKLPETANLTRNHTVLDDQGIATLGRQAGDYSELATGGLGIVVLIGDDVYSKGLTPEHAANVIQAKLKENGAPSLACFGYIGNKRSSVTFILRNDSVGPVSPVEAVQQVPEIAEKYRIQDLIEGD